MIAARESRCRVCGRTIATGDEISRVGKQSWGHADCVEASQRR